MSRPRRPNAKDRSRKPAEVPVVFVRRTELARATGTTEGWWRQLADRGDGPPVVRIGRVCLYELNPSLEWLRRNAVSPAA